LIITNGILIVGGSKFGNSSDLPSFSSSPFALNLSSVAVEREKFDVENAALSGALLHSSLLIPSSCSVDGVLLEREDEKKIEG
jgi:hypothetical protein